MIILIDGEKESDKLQYHFMIKVFNEWVKEGMYLSITKPYDNPIVNIICNF